MLLQADCLNGWWVGWMRGGCVGETNLSKHASRIAPKCTYEVGSPTATIHHHPLLPAIFFPPNGARSAVSAEQTI